MVTDGPLRRARLPALSAALLASLAACSAAPTSGVGERGEDFVACEAPRPEICTQEYVPVCAERLVVGKEGVADAAAGVVERVTRPNRCRACSDADVVGYEPGACGADPIDSPTILDL